MNNSVYGVLVNSVAMMIVTRNRLRDNTSGNFLGMANYPSDLDNYTAAGVDADEFVDVAGEDFRIKSGSTYHSERIGAGDEPVAAGGGTITHWG